MKIGNTHSKTNSKSMERQYETQSNSVGCSIRTRKASARSASGDESVAAEKRKRNGASKLERQCDTQPNSMGGSIRTRAMRNAIATKPIPIASSEPKAVAIKPEKTLNPAKKAKLKAISEDDSFDYRVFLSGDLVWVKLRGWPAWPARVGYCELQTANCFNLIRFTNQFFSFQINNIISFKPFKCEVEFFNDGRTSNVFASQIEYLFAGFENNPEKIKIHSAINKAAKEAMLAYFFENDLHHQFML